MLRVGITFRRRAACLAGAASVFATLFVIALWSAPLPSSLWSGPTASLYLLDRAGRPIVELPSSSARSQRPVALSEMGEWLPRMAVALEDRRFYTHRGCDFVSAVGAALRNAREGRIVGGASTITEQLVKLASGRTGRSWRAKASETFAAIKLERYWSKERILTEYLNRSEYGNRLAGPEAAAQWYFGKPAKELGLAEAAYLCGLPQAPSRFNPWRYPAAAEQRYRRVLLQLRKCGIVTQEQAVRLAERPPHPGRFQPPNEAPHYVQALLKSLPSVSGILKTTLDLTLQHTAEEMVRNHLRTLNRNDVRGAAMVVLDNSTGAVRALVGSPDFAVSQVNAALVPHSCGSTLKPFIYMDGIERQIFTAATLLPDTPDAIRDTYGDYDPQNYNGRYLGPVRVREALACSLNVPAVVALSQVGARRAFVDLQQWGFQLPRGLDEYGAGFILGNAEVRLLDLTAAYAGIARGGVSVRPVFIAGQRRNGQRLVSAEAAGIVTDILCDNDARARSFGFHSPLALERRTAVKTGTSSGFRDAWTVGFNGTHTVGVWVGNPDGRPMREMLSIRAASPLWAGMMERLLQTDPPVAELQENDRVTEREICKLSGLLPIAQSSGRQKEWFLAGTEPENDASGFFATGTDGVTHPLLPSDYAIWCRSNSNTIGAVSPSDERLAVSQPVDSAVYSVDEALPASQQMVELQCKGGLGKAVRWYVNGTLINSRKDGRVYWQLERGTWQIAARAGEEESVVGVVVE